MDDGIFDKVRPLIGRALHLGPDVTARLRGDDELFSPKLGADSLGIEALTVELETAFGIQVDDMVLVDVGFETVGDVVEIVRRCLAQQS